MKKIFIYSSFIVLLIVLLLSIYTTIHLNKKIEGYKKKLQQQEIFISNLHNEIKSLKEPTELHPIEKAVQDCMKKENYTTYGMSKCVDNSIYAWQDEINKTLTNLKNTLSKDEYKLLLESQNKWDDYKNTMFSILDNTLGQKQGSIYINILSGNKAGIIETRARELESLYYFLIN